MRKEKETVLNDLKFKVTQLGFDDSLALMVSLSKMMGPSVAKFSPGLANSSAAISELLINLSLSDIQKIITKFAKSTCIEREPNSDKWPKLEPEVDLAGDMDLTLRWLLFCLEVNYGNFFSEGGLLADLKKEAVASA